MDAAAGKSHIPPPGIKRPVDSYHRQLHETHGVQIAPPSDENKTGSSSLQPPGQSSTSRRDSFRRDSSRRDSWRDSWRDRIASSSHAAGSPFSHVASFFDSERLARSAVQSEGTYDARGPNRMRWPFLGSIRSQRSSPGSPTTPTPPRPGPDVGLGLGLGGLGSEAGDRPSEIELPWRPAFLRRRVLVVFAVVFAALVGGLEAVLAVSDANDGLRNADQVARFVWQYGVVLVFVVLAALWRRVEHQAATAAPWMRMADKPTEVDKSLLLDYASKFSPWAMVRAAQNGDWLVSCVLAVGILLKVVVVFSTALIAPLVIMAADREAPIQLGANFSQGNAGLGSVDSLPYFAMAGLQTDGMGFPNGVASRVAYLPFSSDDAELASLNATVAGFAGGMDCETAVVTLNGVRFVPGSVRVNVTAETSNCTTDQVIVSTRFLTVANATLPRIFAVLQTGSCGGSTSVDDQRIVVVAGTLDLDVAAIRKAKQKKKATNIDAQLTNATGLICTPRYVVTKFDVSKDPQDLVSIRASADAQNSTIQGVTAWDIAQAHFDSYASTEAVSDTSFASIDKLYQNGTVFHANRPVDAALAMRATESGTPLEVSQLEDAAALRELAEAYFAQYSALLARYAMMGSTSANSTGTSTSMRRRLVARRAPTHLLAALLAVSLVITAFSLAKLSPKKGFLPRSPAALVDTAAVIAHSHPLVECLAGMGAASTSAMRVRLGGSAYATGAEGHEKLGDANRGYFHIFGGKEPPRNAAAAAGVRRAVTTRWRQPVALHGLIRVLYALVLASVIIGFEVSLRASGRRGDGLRDGADDGPFVAWTAVPGLLLLLTALYMADVDWWTRTLAPFGRLRRRGQFRDTIGLNLVDASAPVAFWRAVSIGELASAATVVGGSLAALFVVASAALFEPLSMATSDGIVLRTQDFFANSLASSTEDPVCVNCANDTRAASLILAGDAPFPPFVFADLNLPTVGVDGQTIKDDSNISVTLTAVRPRMQCRVYLADEIETNITLTTKNGVVNPLRIDLAGETCRQKSSNAVISTAQTTALQDTSESNSVLFGAAQGKTNASAQCSDWLYVWGSLSGSDGVSVESINALACNESIEAVDADVNLYGVDLRIDASDPPVPDESSVRDTSVAIPDLDYADLVNVTHVGLLDAFFATLDASPFAPSSALLAGSTAAAAASVQSAILSQHGIIRAQSLNLKVRRHVSSTGAFPSVNGRDIVSGVDPSASVSEAVPLVNAASISRRVRLDQNTTATRILQGIVGSVLVLHVFAWMCAPRNKLPRPPTTIASVAALLVDGNLLRILPREAQWQTKEEVEGNLAESGLAERYGMDWATSRIRKGRDGRRIKIEGGTFGIRAYGPGEGEQEEVEMGPMPSRPPGPRYPPGRPTDGPPQRYPPGRSTLPPVPKPLPTRARPNSMKPVPSLPLPQITVDHSDVPREYLDRRPEHPLPPPPPAKEHRRVPSSSSTERMANLGRRPREQPSRESGLFERLGVVRRGTGTIGSEGVQRRSVLVSEGAGNDPDLDPGVGSSQRESARTSSGTKEIVKVWWAA